MKLLPSCVGEFETWCDGCKKSIEAINAHLLTVAERLIPDEKVGTIKIPLNDIERGYNLAIQDVTTAFRKEYGENDV
jgi:hypothetical protein